MSSGKVIIPGSNATRIETQGGRWGRTGQYLNEKALPAMALIEAGYGGVLATPDGMKPYIDEASDTAAQTPWGLAAIQAKITKPAWKDKPSSFMVTTQDHMIPPSIQRSMAARAGGKIVELQSSHAVMLSHPQDVTDLITGAAGALN